MRRYGVDFPPPLCYTRSMKKSGGIDKNPLTLEDIKEINLFSIILIRVIIHILLAQQTSNSCVCFNQRSVL